MKKSGLLIILLFAFGMVANAQKFALIDMEYIFQNIPAYEHANEELEQLSQKWQNEVEASTRQAQALYKSYQEKVSSLSEAQKTKSEEEIIAKEKETAELRRKYFGQEGELFKRRESLMKPIQDDIYDAVKKISELKGYSLVVDRASATAVIFASPRIDISNEVLAQLGYTN